MDKIRVIFLFMSQGAAPQNSIKKWDKSVPCSEKYTNRATGLYTEGIFYMLVRMLQTGIIDELMVFYESNRGSGYADWGYGIKGYVVPEIRFVNEFMKEGDIIFARGGFRTWHDWLIEKKNKGHWLLTYTANTGRQRWKFWDIIFWDLKEINDIDRHGRFWFYYRKPTNPEIFYPIYNVTPKYDVCIGASHIHDKKGQWRTINALIMYKRMNGHSLKAVLPGAARRGVKSNHIRRLIKEHDLDVDIVSMLPRNEMAEKVYNQSKVFVHLGTSGQNDRGPLEALACGTSIIIGSPSYHSPIVWREPLVSWVPPNLEGYKEISYELKASSEEWNENIKRVVIDYYNQECNLDDVILPQMSKLFNFIRKNPVPSKPIKQELVNIYGE